MRNAFNLPKLKITERFDHERKDVLREVEASEEMFIIYRSKNGEINCLSTGFTDFLFTTIITCIHRHIGLFEFFKAAIVCIEKFRNEEPDAHEFMMQSIEYITLKKRIFNPNT